MVSCEGLQYHSDRGPRTGIFKKLGPTLSLEFGIEYDTDYYTGVLLIPVSQEIANNLLSQIERTKLSIFGMKSFSVYDSSFSWRHSP